MKILVLNPGSNSLKFEVIETGESGDFGSVLVAGSYDGIGNEHSSFSVGQNRSALKKTEVQIRDYGNAAESIFTWIHNNSGRCSPIPALSDIEAMGCRIVHGGDRFRHPAELTDEVLGQIDELKNLAPCTTNPP